MEMERRTAALLVLRRNTVLSRYIYSLGSCALTPSQLRNPSVIRVATRRWDEFLQVRAFSGCKQNYFQVKQKTMVVSNVNWIPVFKILQH